MQDFVNTETGSRSLDVKSASTRELVIREARAEDAEELLSIYAPYVLNTAITFEIEVPSVEEFRRRIVSTRKKYPYLVAERRKWSSDFNEWKSEIVGYAYVGTFKNRAAYDHCVETSVYVSQEACGEGVGTALYAAIELYMPSIGVMNLNACIAWAPEEDEYLNNRSEAFHARLGYTKVAHFHRCGFKFGRYYDMIWMEKILEADSVHSQK